MILRISQKLCVKIGEKPQRSLPLAEDPYADWSVHLFTADRTQYVIVTNTAALYSTIFYGRGVTTDHALISRSLDAIRETMSDEGLDFYYLRFVAPASAQVAFSKALNRSVTGSMNDLIQCAKIWLTEDMSPFDAAKKVNDMPMSALGYSKPRESIRRLLTPRTDDSSCGEVE